MRPRSLVTAESVKALLLRDQCTGHVPGGRGLGHVDVSLLPPWREGVRGSDLAEPDSRCGGACHTY